MSIIEVDNLNFSYPRLNVLRNLSFSIEKGSFVTITGPNGAGKTTLLNLICRALKPQSGSITIDGTVVNSYSSKQLARKLAVVRQEFIPVFGFSVTEVVAMARTPFLNSSTFESEVDKQIIAEALEMTDTSRFASRSLDELSGGERQRVFIARALAQRTPVLLLDEPTSFLDFKHQVGIYDLLKKLQLEKEKTIILVTHDINLSAQYCDRTLLLPSPGSQIPCYIGKPDEVFSAEKIEEVFGVSIFTGGAGAEKFFLPLGKLSRYSSQMKKQAPKNHP